MDTARISRISEPMTGKRTNTGPLKFDGDWAGFFYRGDDALSFANMLRMVADGLEHQEIQLSDVLAFLRTRAAQLDECREPGGL